MARSPAPIYDRMTFDKYEFREYPKWLYGLGKVKLVQSEEEEAGLEGDWYTTPGEAQKAARDAAMAASLAGNVTKAPVTKPGA